MDEVKIYDIMDENRPEENRRTLASLLMLSLRSKRLAEARRAYKSDLCPWTAEKVEKAERKFDMQKKIHNTIN